MKKQPCAFHADEEWKKLALGIPSSPITYFSDNNIFMKPPRSGTAWEWRERQGITTRVSMVDLHFLQMVLVHRLITTQPAATSVGQAIKLSTMICSVSDIGILGGRTADIEITRQDTLLMFPPATTKLGGGLRTSPGRLSPASLLICLCGLQLAFSLLRLID